MKFNIRQTKKGFTLIEIMVALTIFTLVVVMALGALLLVSDSAKQTLALRTAMDNVNIAMESMTRSLRMGRDYSCATGTSITPGVGNVVNDCPLSGDGGKGIVFTTAEKPALSFDTGYILTDRGSGQGKTIQKCVTGQTVCLDIVAKNINIETLKFYVAGSNPTDAVQPSVYIILKGSVTLNNNTIPFSIQTMASQRSSD